MCVASGRRPRIRLCPIRSIRDCDDADNRWLPNIPLLSFRVGSKEEEEEEEEEGETRTTKIDEKEKKNRFNRDLGP